MPLLGWQPGFDAEAHFLQAAFKLGYKEVDKTHPFVPSTIRRTVNHSREDHRGIDFLITLPRGPQGRVRPIIPLQLTLAWDGVDYGSLAWEETRAGLMRKQEREERGFVALFWHVSELGQQGVIDLLRNAAQGDPSALEQFKELLNADIEDFLKQRTKRIFRIVFSVLMRDARGQKVSWRSLERLAHAFASRVHEDSDFIRKNFSRKKRPRMVRSIANQYRSQFTRTGYFPGSEPNHKAPSLKDLMSTILHASEKDAWVALSSVQPLLPDWVRRGIKRINRSGRHKDVRLSQIRDLLQGVT